MNTNFTYTKKERKSVELKPVKINIEFLSIEFVLENGERKRATPVKKGNGFVIIENNKIQFNTDLEFL
jgi:hypothetical protein